MMDGTTAGSWGCDTCTYLNTGEAKCCKMCMRKRPDSPDGMPRVFKRKPKSAETVDGGISKTNHNIKTDDTKINDNNKTDNNKTKGDKANDNNAVKYSVKDNKVTVPNVSRPKQMDTKNNKIGAKVSVDTNKGVEKRVIKKPSVPARADKSNTGASAEKKQPVKHKADDRTEGMNYEWVCDKCSVTNEHFFDSCKCCHTEKTNDVVYIMDEVSDKRSKTSPSDEHGKGKSDPKKKESVDKSKTENQEWSCRRCTLKNSVSLSNCSVCESPRFCNIPSPESIPDSIDYSKFPPSPRPPVSPGCSIVTPSAPTLPEPVGQNAVDCSKNSKEGNSKGIKPNSGKTDKNAKTDKFSVVKPVVNNAKGSKGAAGNAGMINTPQGNIAWNKKVEEKETPQEAIWKCPKCTYHNPNKEQKCLMCYEDKNAKPHVKWVCSKCTFVNEPDNVKCQMCHNVKGQVKNAVEEMEIDSPCCDKAGAKPKPSTSKSSPDKTEPKTPLRTDLKTDLHCRVCTYLNTSTIGSCKMCGQNLSAFEDDKIVSPGTLRPKHTLQRQQSTLMRELREEEDTEAIELWQNITMFCKQVGFQGNITQVYGNIGNKGT